jgi:ElaB/YqjD/DUF883 family membrane-anchored ribosome-binding protein
MANTNANKGREGVAQTASSVVDKAKDMASEAKDKVQETAHSFTERAGEVASNVTHRAGEMASNVAHRAGEAASNVGKKVDSGVSAAGSGMQSFAETVRDRGPSSGVLGSATSAVADTLENTGEYLETHGLSGIASDLTDMIRRNPIPALLIGIGVGFLIARATRS